MGNLLPKGHCNADYTYIDAQHEDLSVKYEDSIEFEDRYTLIKLNEEGTSHKVIL